MSSAAPRIAIVGMALRFAGASEPEAFARLVEGGVDASSGVPDGRWPLAPEAVVTAGALGIPGRVPAARGYFLRPEASDCADLRGLGLDPLFGLTLAVGREAYASCRNADLDLRRVGLILGNLALPTTASSQLAQELVGAAFLERAHGLAPLDALGVAPANAAVAGLPTLLLARKLGLGGTCFALDAACASTLYALRFAMRELSSGRADAMIAGGVSRPDPFYTQMGFAQLRALAPDGVSRPFDERAGGLVVGEGAGMFVLKRLDDALREGDRILGLITGAGVSNDLDSGMMAPSSEGQLRALRDAYLEAGWDPRDVDFIEAHATGTPLGDQVEVESLKSLWREAGGAIGKHVPLGSVKANVGHLLTAAGASSLAKALLAIERKTVAPTANFTAPAARLALEDGPFEILREPRQLEKRGPLRAAISGFGFGGINAHLLIEEWCGQTERAPARKAPAPREVAIVGVGASTGRFESFANLATARAVPPPPWMGLEETRTFANLIGTLAPALAVHELELDAAALRLPPAELQDLNPQQLLALAAATEAARAGGLTPGGRQPRAGVYLGMALDGATNHFSCRFAHGDAASFVPEMTATRVMGNLASVAASRIARAFGLGGLGIAVAAEAESGLRALGLAVEAIRRGELDLAMAGGVDCAAQYLNAQARRLGRGGEAKTTEDVAVMLVLKDLAGALRDGDRVLGVIGVDVGEDADARVGPAVRLDEDFEHGAATGLLSIARAVSMLSTALLPHGDYWLRDRIAGPRELCLSGFRLREGPGQHPHFAAPSLARQALFLVAAATRPKLVLAVESLFATLEASPLAAWPRLAADTWEDATLAAATGGTRWRAAFHWSGDPDAVASWRAASSAGRVSDEACGFWLADGADDPPRLAFLFPGAGSHYQQMGRELASAFPALMERQDRESARLRSQWSPESFWKDGAAQPEMVEALGGPCALAALVVDTLAALGVAPDATIGYSLGESAALLAMRAWRGRDEVYERLVASTIFTTELAGPMLAARRYFGLAPNAPLSWANFLVRRGQAEVRAALEGSSRVFLNNVNSPQECIIGGDASEARAVLRKLGHAEFELPRIPALHCPVVREIEDEFQSFHEFPLTAPAGVTFYGGAQGEPIPLSSRGAAEAILAHAWHGVDFPKMIERAYADGVRVFLEMGPGAGLTRLVREILGSRPFVAASVCPREGQERAGLFGALALAFVHGRSLRVDRGLLVAAERPVARAGVTVRFGAQAGGKFVAVAGPEKAERVDAMTDQIVEAVVAARAATAAAHSSFLASTREMVGAVGVALKSSASATTSTPTSSSATEFPVGIPVWDLTNRPPFNPDPAWLDFSACQTLARGRLGDVLGPDFAAVDAFPVRVRLPDGPLLLCHRIMSVEAVPRSLGSGTLITEHDVHADAWYLDDGRIPTCVAVEAGQADLFLSAYLGIDFKTEGRAVYRLLDAVVTFHDRLPTPGTTIRYEIKVHSFFDQGETTLFRFSFEAKVSGKKLITMEQGCAGFFTAAELAAGRGIVKTSLDLRPVPGKVTGDYAPLVSMAHERYDDSQLDALRRGDYVACFGEAFAALALETPKTVPDGMLRLVHRILELDPQGGRYGLGMIRGEADIRPDDWFLTCHFVDDQVMPGTLMYECCNHTMRILLMRAGWVGEACDLPCEPLEGVASRLKCRGQVLAGTQKVEYRIEIKEIGYGPDAYAIADALMYADGKPIVEILDMSLCHRGLTKERAAAVWRKVAPKPALYDKDRILAFSSGNPSEAFGEPYRIFDTPRGAQRKIARLPRPPYQFLDRITETAAEPWKLEAGGRIEAQYDVPPDAWYFAASGAAASMPFAILLEIALQPCGWYSAYMGSALASPVDLSYRNLGGKGVQHRAVTPETGTLTTSVDASKVSHSAGMIIQSFAFRVTAAAGLVYEGETMFGFFTKDALAQQVGLRGVTAPASLDVPAVAPYPDRPQLPRAPMLMVDEIVAFSAERLHGRKRVDPAEWFFEAHFFEDPVMPGSLGLEAFLQLLMLAAAELWPDARGFQAVAPGAEHSWTYRGQVIPRNGRTDVLAEVTAVDHAARRLTGSGTLLVDGLPIYAMEGFAITAL